jgi:hypothetical protein
MTDHSLSGDAFTMLFTQDPPIEMNTQFAITGHLSPTLGFGSNNGAYIGMSFSDLFGDTLTMRIYHDGYDPPSLGLIRGSAFPNVYIISNDGVRLRIMSGGTIIQTTTTYPVYAPSVMYTLKDMVPLKLPYDVGGYSESFVIDNVATNRILEHEMAYNGGTNDVARVGAEVAYAVATDRLGLKNVVMNDPAEGGADLYTPGHSVVVEARMLQSTVHMSGKALDDKITENLNQMVGRLNNDLRYYKGQGLNPTAGYAVFTYILDQNTIKTIVLKVLPQ